MTTGRTSGLADSLVERLTRGHDHHGQRWRLHLPEDGEARPEVRPLLVVLALPTFGLAFAISVVTTFGPVILIRFTDSTTTVGALIGGEGAFALVVPLAAGALSDRLPASPLGRRLPFVLAATPLVVAGLALLPFSGSIAVAGAAVLAFFVGYYLYYPPYRALYADLLPRTLYARAQAGQAIARGAGLGVALLAGGLLLGVWQPLVFLIGAAVVVAGTVALLPVFRLQSRCGNRPLPYEPASLRELLLGSSKLRVFAVVNALWEFSFAGLKSFIVLYVVRGLGRSPALASAVIAVVAVAYVAGAPIAGRLADRYGYRAVIAPGAALFALGAGSYAVAMTATPHYLTHFLPGALLVGVSIGAAFSMLGAASSQVLPPELYGAGAAVNSTARQLGAVLGVAVLVAVLGTPAPEDALAAFGRSWTVTACVAAACAVSALLLRPAAKR